MSINEMETKIAKIQQREALAKEAAEIPESHKDENNAEMLKRDTEELEAGRFICRWTTVLANRFDTTAFKKVMPDVYKAYTKQSQSRRFTVSA